MPWQQKNALPAVVGSRWCRFRGSALDLFGNYVSAQVGEFKIAEIARF